MRASFPIDFYFLLWLKRPKPSLLFFVCYLFSHAFVPEIMWFLDDKWCGMSHARTDLLVWKLVSFRLGEVCLNCSSNGFFPSVSLAPTFSIFFNSHTRPLGQITYFFFPFLPPSPISFSVLLFQHTYLPTLTVNFLLQWHISIFLRVLFLFY